MNKVTKIFLFTLFLYTLHTLNTPHLYSQLVSDFRVNDDSTVTAQLASSLAVDISGNCVVVWEDSRNGNRNIFGQRFNQNGIFVGQNFRVNVNPDSSNLPSVAVAKNNNIGICWLEINSAINFSSKIKFRLFNANAQPLTNEILISDSLGNFFSGPSISEDINGGFIITWSRIDILYQRIDSLGNKLGNNVRVNDDTGYNLHDHPDITVRIDGNFIIAWEDTRLPSSPSADDIYFQIFDNFGNRIGSNRKVNNDSDSSNFQFNPRIAHFHSGEFILAWNDNRLDEDGSEIFGQKFSFSGNKVGDNFRVSQSSTFNPKGMGAIGIRTDGSSVIYWTEFGSLFGVPFFQRFDPNGNLIGTNFKVTNQFPSSEKFASDCKIFNDRIISVWDDERNGPFDIYCNIRSFSNPDTTVSIINISSQIPGNFQLFQNYPNPFNGSTMIKFDITQTGFYSLEIYNILGQLKQTFFTKFLQPGSYKITYSLENLSSGIYQYILHSKDKRIVKTLLLIK